MDALIACLLVCWPIGIYGMHTKLCDKLYLYFHPTSKISSYHSYSQISSLTYNKSLRSNTRFSVSNHKSLKTGHPSYLSSLLSLTPHRSNRSSSITTLNRPPVTSGLKMSNWSFFHSEPVLWNSLSPHLRHSAHHSTSSSPTSGSCNSDLLTAVFLNKKKNLTSFAFPFHLNLYSPGLLTDGYLWY